MKLNLNVPNPAEAREYFLNKLKFIMGPAELEHFKEQGTALNLIDVRGASDYAQGHVPGAVSLPEEEWNSARGLTKDKVNVLYGYNNVCQLAARAAVVFASEGYPVMEMKGGFAEWQLHGRPIQKGAPSVQQQPAVPRDRMSA